jgi:hypothetical protein
MESMELVNTDLFSAHHYVQVSAVSATQFMVFHGTMDSMESLIQICVQHTILHKCWQFLQSQSGF